VSEDILFPVTDTSGICEDCKHLAPRLRIYGKVTICHACTVRRLKVFRGDEPQTHRPKEPYEKPVKDRRCTDCRSLERDGRHWADAYLCETCETEMLKLIPALT